MKMKSSESMNTSREGNKYLKLTEEEKRHHVLAYLKGPLSRRAYCDQQGLKLSSFKNWARRYNSKRTSNFIPIIAAPKSEKRKSTPRIEIYKGNYKVVLSEIENVTAAIVLIKGVISCS